jgi:predicted outer membrane repeat protein
MHTVDDSGGADFLTIGEAIAACSAGDTVYVMPGTYTGAQNRGIHFDDTTTVIEGLRIANGYGGATPPYTSGGAIYLHSGSDAIVRDCEFDNNTAVTGGAIHGNYDLSIVTGCRFEGNTAYGGGAVLLYYSQTTVRDCEFLNANEATACGGGVYLEFSPCATVQRCTFTENVAQNGAGVGCFVSSALIEDSIFAGNVATAAGRASSGAVR